MSSFDPIRNQYFKNVQITELLLELLFYVNASLSCLILLINQNLYQILFDIALSAFSISVVIMLSLNLLLKLYLIPRAESKRREDFFAHAYDIKISYEKTSGYYNNAAKEPIQKIALQTLENCFFSKNVSGKMLFAERTKFVIYIVLWLFLVHFRQTDLAWIVVATQAIFSEQILSKWLRLEWFYRQCDSTFNRLYRVLQSKQLATQRNSQILEITLSYETAKANASITLSSNYFDKLNKPLSTEWGKIEQNLNSQRN